MLMMREQFSQLKLNALSVGLNSKCYLEKIYRFKAHSTQRNKHTNYTNHHVVR